MPTPKTQLLQRAFSALDLSTEEIEQLMALKPIQGYETQIGNLQQEAEQKAKRVIDDINVLERELMLKKNSSQDPLVTSICDQFLSPLVKLRTFYQICSEAFEQFPFVSVTVAWQEAHAALVAYTDLYQKHGKHPMFAERVDSSLPLKDYAASVWQIALKQPSYYETVRNENQKLFSKLGAVDPLADISPENYDLVDQHAASANLLINLVVSLRIQLSQQCTQLPVIIDPTLVEISRYNSAVHNVHSDVERIAKLITDNPEHVKESIDKLIKQMLDTMLLVEDLQDGTLQRTELLKRADAIQAITLDEGSLPHYCAVLSVLDAILADPRYAQHPDKGQKQTIEEAQKAIDEKLTDYFKQVQRTYHAVRDAYYDKVLEEGLTAAKQPFLQTPACQIYMSAMATLHQALSLTAGDGNSADRLFQKVDIAQRQFVDMQREVAEDTSKGIAVEKQLAKHIMGQVLQGQDFSAKLKAEVKTANTELAGAIAREKNCLTQLRDTALTGTLAANVENILTRLIHIRILDRYLKEQFKTGTSFSGGFKKMFHAISSDPEITANVSTIEDYILQALDGNDTGKQSPTTADVLTSDSRKLIALYTILDSISLIIEIKEKAIGIDNPFVKLFKMLRDVATARETELITAVHNAGPLLVAEIKKVYTVLQAEHVALPLAKGFYQRIVALIDSYLLCDEAKKLTVLTTTGDASTQTIIDAIVQLGKIAKRQAVCRAQFNHESQPDEKFAATMGQIDERVSAQIGHLKKFMDEQLQSLTPDQATAIQSVVKEQVKGERSSDALIGFLGLLLMQLAPKTGANRQSMAKIINPAVVAGTIFGPDTTSSPGIPGRAFEGDDAERRTITATLVKP